jgi:DUF1365 family protein
VTASALYVGHVRHRRTGTGHPGEFRHRIALALLDLDELPELLDGLLVRRGPGLVRVRERDLLGGARTKDAARELVAQRTGAPAPGGPVRVLTHPRAFGVCFNPVSFYFLHHADGALGAVVAEVTSTPWGERRAYVLRGEGPVLRGEHAKALHVSPFQPMDRRHVWAVTPPGRTLSVHIANRTQDGATDFDATLALARRPLTRPTLAGAAVRHPGGSLRTLALIYGHALGLKLRGAPHFRHPAKEAAA